MKDYIKCSLLNVLHPIRKLTSTPNFLSVFFSYHEWVLTLTERFSAFIKMFIFFLLFNSIKMVDLID